MRDIKGSVGVAISVIAVVMGLFHLYSAAFGTLVALNQRAIHLSFAFCLAFLLYPPTKTAPKDRIFVLDYLLAALSVVVFSYISINYEEITLRLTLVDPLSASDIILGAAAILLILEAARRTLGKTMAIIPVLAILFAIFGAYLPGVLTHRGFTLQQVIEYMYLGYHGIFGMPVGVSSSYLVLFIIFGAFLEKSGTGTFIINFAQGIAGRTRGGPAQVSVISSALFGTVSGTAVANVYSTGTFTIPLMKRTGYSPEFAGAVEAVASTGGQLMPPVLGAAAFIMAEWIGVPYIDVVKASAIPALLYFLAVGLIIHLEAVRTGVQPLPKEEIPPLREAMKNVHLILPLFVIVAVLFAGYSVFRSAFFGIIAAVAVSVVRKSTRMNLRMMIEALEIGCKRAVIMAVATACAGIIVGVFTLTGVGLNITSIVVLHFQDQIFLALVFTMIASIILGMGVPTVVAYILVGTLAAPVIMNLGVSMLAAHMFVFFFGIIAMITPPVAISCWAGAEIAGGSYLKTGFTAVKLGIVAFIVPYMFVFGPPLLGEGTALQILAALCSAVIGTVSLAGGLQGWLLVAAPVWQRIALIAGGLALMTFGAYSDAIGIGLFVLVLAFQLLKARAEKSERCRGAAS